MSQRILITGATGLVGSRFVELHKNKNELLTPKVDEMDLTSKRSVERYLYKSNPDVIINFAAYTDVNGAENQREDRNSDCWKINVVGVQNLISKIPDSTHFIQISTDNVFPGSKENPGPYKEDDIPEDNSDKLVWYGYTKAEAEREIIKKIGSSAAILRIIYPFRAHFAEKLDYVRKPLALFDQGKLYPMFSDQQISVTFIDEVCMALEKIIKLKKKGIFHACSSDATTPFELVSYLLEEVRGVKNAVKPSSLDEFLKTVDNPVRYPKYGGLSVEETEKELGIKFGTWKQMVNKFISQIEKS